jgi:hypothetical protein
MTKKTTGLMVSGLVVFLIFIIFLIQVSAFEYVRTITGTQTTTVDTVGSYAARTGNVRLTDYSDTTITTLEGSYINFRYRYMTESVMTATSDSFAIKFTFSPTIATGVDTMLCQTKTIGIAAPTNVWQYGAVGYKLDTSSTFNRIIRIWDVTNDSMTSTQEAAQKAVHYHRYLQWWLEIWK